MRPDISRLRPRTAITTRYSNVGTIQTYTDTLAYFWNKFTNQLEHVQGPDASEVLFYRAEAFLNRHAALRTTILNAEDTIVFRSAASTRTFITHTHAAIRRQATTLASLHYFINRDNSNGAVLKWLLALFMTSAMCVSITLPFLLSYFVFLALVPHQPALLLVAMAILSIYVLLGIWSHQGMSHLRKIRLSLFAPAYFAPFYILTITSSVVTITTTAHILWASASKRTALRKKVLFH
ncbi:hypothetical protein D3C85_994550 [compost metagenome]